MNETRSSVLDIVSKVQIHLIMKESPFVIIGFFNQQSVFDVPWIRFLEKTATELAGPMDWGEFLYARVYIGKGEVGDELFRKAGLTSTPSIVLFKDGEIQDSFPVYGLDEQDALSRILSWVIDAGTQ